MESNLSKKNDSKLLMSSRHQKPERNLIQGDDRTPVHYRGYANVGINKSFDFKHI